MCVCTRVKQLLWGSPAAELASGTFGCNYWEGRDYRFIQSFLFKLCQTWLSRINLLGCLPGSLVCVCVWRAGVMVEGAVKPHTSSEKMKRRSLAQTGSWVDKSRQKQTLLS